MTPYIFIPKVGTTYVKQYYTDMGEGLLLCMQEMSDKIYIRILNDGDRNSTWTRRDVGRNDVFKIMKSV